MRSSHPLSRGQELRGSKKGIQSGPATSLIEGLWIFTMTTLPLRRLTASAAMAMCTAPWWNTARIITRPGSWKKLYREIKSIV